ncbi:MAG: RES family NAD+ phosphorylase [Bacteroidetes bacterium]|nr:RES family NAD+ phosphorylase [Bacteroidota bacterium]
MIVYRLSQSSYAADLSGIGAEMAGGRWNSKGTPMIYAAESRALCVAELAMHLPLGLVPQNYAFVSFKIPENIPVLQLSKKQLPSNWNEYPHPNETQQIGDRFIRDNKFLVMRVPSVVVNEEYNYLINPRHSLIQKVQVSDLSPFKFNERFFRK